MLIAGCDNAEEGVLQIGAIDNDADLFADGVRLSPAAQHIRGAIRSGLVSLDEQGEVIPALADRWTVTEGGRIFVFRLRDGTWPDGSDLSAETVRGALENAIRELRGTSLGLDLAPIDEVRAMAGRVIEIRLSSAMPDLLQLLAQPELGLKHGEGESGPMTLVRRNDLDSLLMKPPEARGEPESEDWQNDVRTLRVLGMDSGEAMKRFDNGEVELVLGGRLGELPMVDIGPLSRGTIRLDPAIGLFGLQVRTARGMLASDEVREGIAMALDRTALLAQFNIGGWVPTTRVVLPGLPDDPGLIPERWQGQSLEDLRATAAARVSRWRATDDNATDESKQMRVLLPRNEGFDMLYRELARQLATIGITLARADDVRDADLVLVDRVARYAAPRWFLNQFQCSLDRGMCSEEMDILLADALDEDDPQRRGYLLAEAEAALTLANVYIPFGSPIRWSLVRGTVNGYAPNRWAFHPLPEMAVIPR